MVEIETGLRENTVGVIEQFAAIAAVDPLVGAMLLSGAIITGFAMGVFGVLTIGAIAASIKRATAGSEAPNQPV